MRTPTAIEHQHLTSGYVAFTPATYLQSACGRLDAQLATLLGWQAIDAASGPWITGWAPGVRQIASTRRAIPLWSSKPALVYELMCAYRCFPRYVPYDILRHRPAMMEIDLPNAIGCIREVIDDHGGSIEAATGCAVARAAVFILTQAQEAAHEGGSLPHDHVDLSGIHPPPFPQKDRRQEPRESGADLSGERTCAYHVL